MSGRGGTGSARADRDRQPDGAGASRWVAVVEKRGRFLVAEPFFGSGPRMAVSRDSRYAAGDLVLVSQAASGRRGQGSRARVLRRLGTPEVARDVIEALMYDRGLARAFEPPVNRLAGEVCGRALSANGGRRDLRRLTTFTIDPASARDFDDAISCRRADGGDFEVWVHIADVSAYVTPRDALDREAYARGTSVYVPGAVEPMLPVEISNGACSLVPDEDRLAVTVELVVRDGCVVSAAFYRSLIRSQKRLSYDQVDAIFAGVERGGGEWGKGLASARAAAASLGARRAADRSLVLEGAEPEFEFDRDGHVAGATRSVQTESHRMIEQLMVAANEQVAWFLSDRRIPALYRVHERPEAAAVERMIEQLASLGVPTPPVPGGRLTGQQAAEIAGEASQMVADWTRRNDGRGATALQRLVLRSLQQAHYDPVNRGHSGLGLSAYCHFTSPIRRYPDLICHRALLSAIDGSEPAPDAAWVAAAGPACSAAERRAMLIERDADDIARCFLLQHQLDDPHAEFEGEIVGVIGSGAFVAFGPELAYEGMLPVRRMREDWWELNDAATALIGTRKGGALRLGDRIAVRVDGIDAPRGRVDLVPADTTG